MVFFQILAKNVSKSNLKRKPKKHRKLISTGTQNRPKIVPKSLKFRSFSDKLHTNNRFSDFHFWHDFLHQYFRLCRSIFGPKLPSWQKVLSSIFTIFGAFSVFFRFFLPPAVFCSFLFVWNATSTQK